MWQARITDHLAARQVEPRFLRTPRLKLDELCLVSHRADADVLVLDNMLVAHGRGAYSGPREIVIGMAEPTEWKDVAHWD